MRRLGLWKRFAAYFPIGLQKTAELDPEKSYLFAYHPHGILGIGAFAAFGTEALDFSKTFPGITPHLMTLDMNFKPPFLREFIMSMGACAVNRKSCANILQSGPGESIAIVVGGAAEALEAKSKTATLVLKERMGFVKVALQTGASLVPVFAFGENDVFAQVNNPHGSLLRRMQTQVKDAMGFAPAVFHGRGIFNYTLGLLPYRRPITVVVGKPIDVDKVDGPTREQVKDLHARYVDSLTELFNAHKVEHGIDQATKLEII